MAILTEYTYRYYIYRVTLTTESLNEDWSFNIQQYKTSL